jgi:hypothetical protein
MHCDILREDVPEKWLLLALICLTMIPHSCPKQLPVSEIELGTEGKRSDDVTVITLYMQSSKHRTSRKGTIAV